MTCSLTRGVLGLAMVLVAQQGAARAQVSAPPKKPIDVISNAGDFPNSKCLQIYKNATKALNSQTSLRAAVINIHFKAKTDPSSGSVTCGDIDRIEADGGVSYTTPTEAVRADNAVYAADADQIVLQGHVVVGQGKNVVEGDRLVIQISAHHALIESSASGASGDSSRVHGVFNLDENGKTK